MLLIHVQGLFSQVGNTVRSILHLLMLASSIHLLPWIS
jgi:hypothetical protein